MGKITRVIRSSVGLPETIEGISTPTVFTVGAPVVDGGDPVSDILFHRDGVVKDMGACYTVRFGGDSIVIIPNTVVLEITRVEPLPKKKEKPQADLPEEV